MLENLKVLLDVNADDTSKINKLNILITECTAFALNYCHLDDVTASLNQVIQLMVMERWSMLKSEGVSTSSYDGVSESYNSDYSDRVYKQLQSHRKVRVI